MFTSLRSPARSLLLVIGAVAIVAVGGGAAAQADELPPPPVPECVPGPPSNSDHNGCWIPPNHRGAALAPEHLRTVVPGRAIVPPPRELHDRTILPRPTPGCGGPLVFCP